MTVFVNTFDESLKQQPGEERYLFRFFGGGVPLFQKFVAQMPSTWRVHTYTPGQGCPGVLFSVDSEIES